MECDIHPLNVFRVIRGLVSGLVDDQRCGAASQVQRGRMDEELIPFSFSEGS